MRGRLVRRKHQGIHADRAGCTIRENFLKGCFRRRATRLLTQDGKYLQTLPASAMSAKNKDGQNRRGFQGLPVNPLVPVKLVQVKKLMVDIEARLMAHEAGFFTGELFSEAPNTKFHESAPPRRCNDLRQGQQQELAWPCVAPLL
jgi:hypothetical protein